MPRRTIKAAELDVKKSRMIVALSEMPPLNHWPNRENDFDFLESEVCQWIMKQPELWSWAFQKAQDLGVIRFSDGKWVGIAHEPQERK